MGMGGGGTNGAVSDINVTPLIDVLLVLLIIFMVIVPVTPKGLDTLIPQPPKDKSTPPPETTIVVSIQANGNSEPSYLINQDVFAKPQLETKLREYSLRDREATRSCSSRATPRLTSARLPK